MQCDPDHHGAEDGHLSRAELDAIVEAVNRGGDHCWGFRLEAAIAVRKEEKRKRKAALLCGPYGDWPVDGH